MAFRDEKASLLREQYLTASSTEAMAIKVFC